MNTTLKKSNLTFDLPVHLMVRKYQERRSTLENLLEELEDNKDEITEKEYAEQKSYLKEPRVIIKRIEEVQDIERKDAVIEEIQANGDNATEEVKADWDIEEIKVEDRDDCVTENFQADNDSIGNFDDIFEDRIIEDVDADIEEAKICRDDSNKTTHDNDIGIVEEEAAEQYLAKERARVPTVVPMEMDENDELDKDTDDQTNTQEPIMTQYDSHSHEEEVDLYGMSESDDVRETEEGCGYTSGHAATSPVEYVIISSDDEGDYDYKKPSSIDSMFPYEDYRDYFRDEKDSKSDHAIEENINEQPITDNKELNIHSALEELFEKTFAKPTTINLLSDDDDQLDDTQHQEILPDPIGNNPFNVSCSLSSYESVCTPKDEVEAADVPSEGYIGADEENMDFMYIVRLPSKSNEKRKTSGKKRAQKRRRS